MVSAGFKIFIPVPPKACSTKYFPEPWKDVCSVNIYDPLVSISLILKYARPWRGKIVLSSIYSILNKLFDIAPEILIGIAVDLVVKRQDSIIAQLGFESIQSQITVLAIATFLIWAFESFFQYL